MAPGCLNLAARKPFTTAEIELLTAELGADAILGRAATVLSSQTVGSLVQSRRSVPAMAALLAAIGVGLVPPETDWTVIASEVTPDADNSESYDLVYPTWREVYAATEDLVHRLSAEPTKER
ncbi:hypothetical protein MCHIJ_13980 [Mycolicibacterium chitae]|uniref:Carbohydrate kinase FGGY n=2 Tax=Mycolicibacterium chitae TaxID=1792 RepID=A0A3S4SDI9_MYCCI|nr:hypothetical protein MCHIJ_13980 [Mycolicibacterium chitae]VEG50786.1 carbohydrate kinase FGGY [Mycolicibacterium chitae]